MKRETNTKTKKFVYVRGTELAYPYVEHKSFSVGEKVIKELSKLPQNLRKFFWDTLIKQSTNHPASLIRPGRTAKVRTLFFTHIVHIFTICKKKYYLCLKVLLPSKRFIFINVSDKVNMLRY